MLPHIQLPVRQLELPAVAAIVVLVRPWLDIHAMHLQQTRRSDTRQAASQCTAELWRCQTQPLLLQQMQESRLMGLHTSNLLEVPLKGTGPPKMCL